MPPRPRQHAPAPSDGELVAAARHGDAAALGALLERHRPRLFATALRLLGYRPDAEDAVHETWLVALQHLGTVRQPDAVGGWLDAVLRRACLMHLRRHGGAVRTDTLPEVADWRPGPEERIERLELRDWVWAALQRLPESLRATAMLRYFGSYDSYDEVAATLGVPVGTVRSRLSAARLALAEALRASAGLVADDARARDRARARFWREALDEAFRRGDSGRFVAHCAADLLVAWSDGATARGRAHLAAEIDDDLAAGVRLEPQRVMTSDGVTVVEGRFVNPAEAPDHCPPGIALVLFGRGDTASRIHLHLAPRRPRPDDA